MFNRKADDAWSGNVLNQSRMSPPLLRNTDCHTVSRHKRLRLGGQSVTETHFAAIHLGNESHNANGMLPHSAQQPTASSVSLRGCSRATLSQENLTTDC